MFTLSYPFRPWTGQEGHHGRRVHYPHLRRGDGSPRPGCDAHRASAPACSRRPGPRPTRGGLSAPSPAASSGCDLLRSSTCAPAITTTTRATSPTSPISGGLRRNLRSTRSSGLADLDHAGKKVVVIGSGATAMTLVPAMTDISPLKVTMLQRTPDLRRLRCPSNDVHRQRSCVKVLPAGPSRTRSPAPSGSCTCRSDLLRCPASAFPPWPSKLLSWLDRRCGTSRMPTSTPSTSPRTTSPGTSACAWCPDGDMFYRLIRGGTHRTSSPSHIERFVPGGIKLTTGRGAARGSSSSPRPG